MTGERCETCKFLLSFPHGYPSDESNGLCRRYPPQFVTHNGERFSNDYQKRPAMQNDDWCGEWKQK